MVNQQIPTEGQFFISVDGNRLKQYANNIVYLTNNSEFQLELFNPTTSKVLAKIKINGNYISSTGIALKPGQRVFLERYLDMAKKFKFETYQVDNSTETKSAIANNGLVEVEFYKEGIPVTYTYCPPVNWDWNYNNNQIYYSSTLATGTPTISNPANTNIRTSSLINDDSLLSGNINGAISSSFYCSTNSGMFVVPSLDFGELKSKAMEPSKEKLEFEKFSKNIEKKTTETGRIEQGSYSQQSFSNDYSNFNTWYSNKVTWKILPLSQKPVEVSDLKTYCCQCGAQKKRPNWIYCPSCGAKFE